MWKLPLFFLATVLFGGACVGQSQLTPAADSPDGSGPSEQLIVLVQDGSMAASERFKRDDLPAIIELAQEMDLPFEVVSINRGAPEEVHLTPLIVYANSRGRSFYQGRTKTVDRIANFIQTARVVPQGTAKLIREDILVKPMGRAKVAMPIKVTPLAGVVPEGFDQDALMSQLMSDIASSSLDFKMNERVELGRSDRLFYADLYPYRSETGELYLSTALFSQFHCHKPIYVRQSERVWSGRWDESERRSLFVEALTDLRHQVLVAIARSNVGDAFVPVGPEVPVISWEELGLPLPAPPASAMGRVHAEFQMPTRWSVQSAGSVLQFRFPAPLDGYSGRVESFGGELVFGEDASVPDASGHFDAVADSVTMGEPDLDQSIHGVMLDAKNHPISRFTIETVVSDFSTLSFATILPVTLTGSFQMKGLKVPLTVPVQLEVLIDENGQPQLVMDGQWTLPLTPFDVEGPDESEQSKMLEFICRFVLQPQSDGQDDQP